MNQVNRTTTLTVCGVVVNIKLQPLVYFDMEVLTPDGQPSELSVYGLRGDGAAKVLVQLASLLAECPEAAETPKANMATVRTLARMGVPYARGAALAARPIRANKINYNLVGIPSEKG